MALPNSGVISAQDINLELGRVATAPFSLTGLDERALAGIPSGTISFSDFYGKSSQVTFIIAPVYFDSINKFYGVSGSGSGSVVQGDVSLSDGNDYTVTQFLDYEGAFSNQQMGLRRVGVVDGGLNFEGDSQDFVKVSVASNPEFFTTFASVSTGQYLYSTSGAGASAAGLEGLENALAAAAASSGNIELAIEIIPAPKAATDSKITIGVSGSKIGYSQGVMGSLSTWNDGGNITIAGVGGYTLRSFYYDDTLPLVDGVYTPTIVVEIDYNGNPDLQIGDWRTGTVNGRSLNQSQFAPSEFTNTTGVRCKWHLVASDFVNYFFEGNPTGSEVIVAMNKYHGDFHRNYFIANIPDESLNITEYHNLTDYGFARGLNRGADSSIVYEQHPFKYSSTLPNELLVSIRKGFGGDAGNDLLKVTFQGNLPKTHFNEAELFFQTASGVYNTVKFKNSVGYYVHQGTQTTWEFDGYGLAPQQYARIGFVYND